MKSFAGNISPLIAKSGFRVLFCFLRRGGMAADSVGVDVEETHTIEALGDMLGAGVLFVLFVVWYESARTNDGPHWRLAIFTIMLLEGINFFFSYGRWGGVW